jgi:hypothetical protein
MFLFQLVGRIMNHFAKRTPRMFQQQKAWSPDSLWECGCISGTNEIEKEWWKGSHVCSYRGRKQEQQEKM